MKLIRLSLAALAVFILILILVRVSRQSPREANAPSGVAPGPPEAALDAADSRVSPPDVSPATVTATAATNSQLPVPVTPTGMQIHASTAIESPGADPAANPPATLPDFGQGAPPATPVPPPPADLFRTNLPEKRPGEGRPYSGP